MKHLAFSGLAAIASFGIGSSVQAQQGAFDPRLPCAQVLADTNPQTRMMVAAWTFGYIAASQNAARPVDTPNNKTILANIKRACAANPQTSLVDLVGGSKSPSASTPGSEAEARVVLQEFLKPGADYVALTAAILPSEADVRAVYGEPLASALWASYTEQLTKGISFAPKPGQTQLLLTRATTRDLVEGKAVLRDFPGGYKDVSKYFIADVPIVRFKFVKPGESIGLAFDGFVHVNGRWVIMPKPWRAIPK